MNEIQPADKGNGRRSLPHGRKICKVKTIQAPEAISKRGIEQYVYHGFVKRSIVARDRVWYDEVHKMVFMRRREGIG